MHKEGHIGIAMILFSPIAAIALYYELYIPIAIGWVIFFFFTNLPDIDLKISFIKHRGITHTVWFGIASSMFVGIAYILFLLKVVQTSPFTEILLPTSIVVITMPFAGVISHITGDIITPTGIKPFAPVKNKKYRVNFLFFPVRASNKVANYLFSLFGTIILIGVLALTVLHKIGKLQALF